MPLDEREQKILQEIEQGLYAQDPGLARKVGRLNKVASRRGVIAAIVFVIGLAVTLGTFAFNQWLALGGFVMMVLAGSAFVHSRRTSANASSTSWIQRFRGGGSNRQ
jgi:amino acid transporter